MDPSDELRHTHSLRRGRSMVESRPVQHGRVCQPLDACAVSLMVVAQHAGPQFVRHTHNWNVEAGGESHDNRKKRWKRVDVLVCVEMRQSNALGCDAIDLGRQLALDFVECDATAQAGNDERLPRRSEPPVIVDEAGHMAGRKRRRTIDEGQMNADAKRGMRSDATEGVRRWRSVREHACARENSSIVGVENAVVHADRQAEVIRVDDEIAKHGYLPGMRNTWAASASPAWNCCQGSNRRRNCATTSWFSNVMCSSCTITHEEWSPYGMPCADSDRTGRSVRPAAFR